MFIEMVVLEIDKMCKKCTKKFYIIKLEAYMFCASEKKTIRQLKLSAEQRPQQHPPSSAVKRPLKSVHLLLMLNHEYVMKLPQ